jgi:hypothetical protein
MKEKTEKTIIDDLLEEHGITVKDECHTNVFTQNNLNANSIENTIDIKSEFERQMNEFEKRNNAYKLKISAKNKTDVDNKMKVRKPAEFAIELVNNLELFVDQYKTPFATITYKNYQIDIPVEGEMFSDYLEHEISTACGDMPSDSVLTRSVKRAKSQAKIRGNVRAVHKRFFQDGDKVVIDLCQDNDLVVEVCDGDWEVVRKGGYKFHRTEEMEPMPTPCAGGDIHDILSFLKIPKLHDRILILVWLVCAFLSKIHRPILLFHGSPGSSKTTAATILQKFIDPLSHGGLYVASKDDDMSLILENYAVPFFDNLSSINQSCRDLLCQAVTDGARAKRKHYANKSLVVTKYMKPIIITAIELPYTAPDLLDRTLPIELVRLTSSERESMTDLMAELKQNYATIFGAILTVLAKALIMVKDVRTKPNFRLLDWARYGLAVVDAIGPEQGVTEANFVAALHNVKNSLILMTHGNNPFPQHMMKFLEENKDSRLQTYSKTANQVYQELQNWVQKNKINTKELPGSDSALSRELTKHTQFFEINGWNMVKKSTNKGTLLSFTKFV